MQQFPASNIKTIYSLLSYEHIFTSLLSGSSFAGCFKLTSWVWRINWSEWTQTSSFSWWSTGSRVPELSSWSSSRRWRTALGSGRCWRSPSRWRSGCRCPARTTAGTLPGLWPAPGCSGWWRGGTAPSRRGRPAGPPEPRWWPSALSSQRWTFLSTASSAPGWSSKCRTRWWKSEWRSWEPAASSRRESLWSGSGIPGSRRKLHTQENVSPPWRWTWECWATSRSPMLAGSLA